MLDIAPSGIANLFTYIFFYPLLAELLLNDIDFVARGAESFLWLIQ